MSINFINLLRYSPIIIDKIELIQSISSVKKWDFKNLLSHVLELRKPELELLNKVTLKLCKMKCYKKKIPINDLEEKYLKSKDISLEDNQRCIALKWYCQGPNKELCGLQCNCKKKHGDFCGKHHPIASHGTIQQANTDKITVILSDFEKWLIEFCNIPLNYILKSKNIKKKKLYNINSSMLKNSKNKMAVYISNLNTLLEQNGLENYEFKREILNDLKNKLQLSEEFSKKDSKILLHVIDEYQNAKIKEEESDNTLKKKYLDFSIEPEFLNSKADTCSWWDDETLDKIMIIDNDSKDTYTIALKKDGDKFLLLNKTKQIVGEAINWINISIPKEFTNKENIVQNPISYGVNLLKYNLYPSYKSFHNLPKKYYYQYYYDSNNKIMKLTNEIEFQ